MSLSDIPLLSILKGKLSYVTQRQAVISQNVANADTPGFAPRDLRAFDGARLLQPSTAVALRPVAAPAASPAALTIPIEAGANGRRFGDETSADSEVRLDGNHVVLEEQMVKLNAARMDYDAAVGFYEQSMALLKTAIRKPGG